jgi:cysteine desulfurase
MKTIYFDYNATTPLDPAVREEMLPYLGEVFGNPSSVHHVGRRARALLDDAHDRVARVWQCKPSEVVFTSGGTESSNLALFGVARLLRDQGKHIITTTIEHHAVLHPCEYLRKKEGFEITCLPVDAEGRVSAESVRNALRSDTVLVSVMAANNEIGTLQPVGEIGAFCRERGVLFHTDAVQWFGKEPFTRIEQFNADLVSVCAHKFHGPKGAGALYIRSPLHPDPILFGGSHENERRAGTENMAAVIGFAAATERFITTPVFENATLAPMADRLVSLADSLRGQGVTFRGARACAAHQPQPVGNATAALQSVGRLTNTVAFTVEGVDSITMLAALDLEGICASSGSACSAGSLEPSHVMLALGVPEKAANSLVRFSLGRASTLEEVAHVERVLPQVITRARR